MGVLFICSSDSRHRKNTKLPIRIVDTIAQTYSFDVGNRKG